MYGEAYLLNTSTAHAADVKFAYLLPSYVAYVTLLTYTHVQPTVTMEAKGVTILVRNIQGEFCLFMLF